ncbi:hypothetical protein BD410DRAFT_843241 [Rickenella mellea]|uniref:Uncharacterized protein n=1 Tax=Rickenella mellea TaxID=50990 RepID=A0A4Y7PR77_9AGAM|nr:hypothetical protein BD410DRAFT_843241 [Rickenella mellea]
MSAPNNTTPDVLPSAPMPIEEYVKKIEDHYGGIKVVQVDLYKASEGARHEYISATVRWPGGRESYLAFERFGGEGIKDVDAGALPDAPDQGQIQALELVPVQFQAQAQAQAQAPSPVRPSPRSSTSSLPSFSSSSTPISSPSTRSSFFRRHAEDMVTHLRNKRHDGNDSLGKTLTIAARPLPLLELALLARAVHEENGDYRPLKHNCYLYAGTLAKLIKEDYDASVTNESTTGTWLYIPVVMEPHIKDSAGPARTMFQNGLAYSKVKIAEGRARLKAELTQDVRQEEEERRRQEEERREQEEERRKQEEERRMEEADKRIKEEERDKLEALAENARLREEIAQLRKGRA